MKRGAAAHAAYLIAITVKGMDGVIESLLGLFIAIAGPEKLYLGVMHFTTPELEANPASHTVLAIQNGAALLAHSSAGFAIFYLLIHGVLKAGLVLCLLLGRRWIFPYAVAILTGFVFIMLYRMTVHFSWWPVWLALFDLFTVALIVNEWVRSGARSA